jgi:DNA replication and repair protein RecF
MFIKNLRIKNFRNIKNIDIEFSPDINLIIAPNGTGKTNILEAISLVSMGKSPRTSSDIDLLPFEQQQSLSIKDFTKITATTDVEKESKEIIISKNQKSPESSVRKTYKLRDKNTTRKRFSEVLHSVYFNPESIGYISQGHSKKRELFDSMIEVSDIEYRTILSEFKKALRNRNIILKKLQTGGNNTELIYWTKSIINNGVKIIKKRWQSLGDYSVLLNTISKELLEDKWLSLEYIPHVESTPLDDEEELKETFLEDLKRLNRSEIYAGKTLKGPHRDKWFIHLDEKDVSRYGSRGQQRIAILAIFLAFYETLQKIDAAKPLLLLDDVTSELDSRHISLLRDKLVGSKTQTFMTSTQKEVLHLFNEVSDKIKIIYLDELL